PRPDGVNNAKFQTRSQIRNVLVCIRNVSDQHSGHPDDRRCLMQDSLFRLVSNTVDVVIKTHPFAEILYWGPHLQHFSPQDAATLERPVANGRLDVDSPVTLMAEPGHGLFGSPGIEGHRQGLDGSPVFSTTDVQQQGQTLTITAEDEHAGLRLTSELALDASGVLVV